MSPYQQRRRQMHQMLPALGQEPNNDTVVFIDINVPDDDLFNDSDDGEYQPFAIVDADIDSEEDEEEDPENDLEDTEETSESEDGRSWRFGSERQTDTNSSNSSGTRDIPDTLATATVPPPQVASHQGPPQQQQQPYEIKDIVGDEEELDKDALLGDSDGEENLNDTGLADEQSYKYGEDGAGLPDEHTGEEFGEGGEEDADMTVPEEDEEEDTEKDQETKGNTQDTAETSESEEEKEDEDGRGGRFHSERQTVTDSLKSSRTRDIPIGPPLQQHRGTSPVPPQQPQALQQPLQPQQQQHSSFQLPVPQAQSPTATVPTQKVPPFQQQQQPCQELADETTEYMTEMHDLQLQVHAQIDLAFNKFKKAAMDAKAALMVKLEASHTEDAIWKDVINRNTKDFQRKTEKLTAVHNGQVTTLESENSKHLQTIKEKEAEIERLRTAMKNTMDGLKKELSLKEKQQCVAVKGSTCEQEFNTCMTDKSTTRKRRSAEAALDEDDILLQEESPTKKIKDIVEDEEELDEDALLGDSDGEENLNDTGLTDEQNGTLA